MNIKKKKIIENFLNEKNDRIITFQPLKKQKFMLIDLYFQKKFNKNVFFSEDAIKKLINLFVNTSGGDDALSTPKKIFQLVSIYLIRKIKLYC